MKEIVLVQGITVILSPIILSMHVVLLSASQLQTNCGFTPTTVTCTGIIPKVVPNETIEVALLAPIEFKAGIFCNVTWPSVRQLTLVYLRYRAYLFDHLFDCLRQIETLKINGSIWFVTSNAFAGLDNVTTLDMSDCSVDSKQLQTLLFLQTTVAKLSNLIIPNNGVPIDINQPLISALSSRPITVLDVSQNDVIFEFHNSTQLCTNLTHLDLSGSSITVKNLPRLCPSLQLTDLSGNFNITRSLKLCKTSTVLRIPSFYSVGVMILSRIILGVDGLHWPACSVTFYHPKLIRELRFSYNNIPNFDIKFDFPFIITNLECIRLSHNNISDIGNDALTLVPTVERVDLSFNNLQKMHTYEETMPYLFRKNFYMSSVDLASNRMSYLPDKTFINNLRLKEILLSYNAFEQLSLNFSHLHSLQILDLRFNNIQYLDQSSRNKVDEFYKQRAKASNGTKDAPHILLEGNSFTCDCVALQFLRWFQTSSIFNASYKCFSNGASYPMTDTAVQVAEENCERPKRELRIILLSTIIPGSGLLGTAILTAVLLKRHKMKKRIKALNERIRLIREERTGYKLLVFLSFSEIDAQFVVDNVYHQLQDQFVSITGSNRYHVSHPEADITPGHSIFGDAVQRLIAESAVFIAVLSTHYCDDYFSQLEISEARSTGKPIILILKESVDKKAMGLVIQDVFMNNKHVKFVCDGTSWRTDSSWDQLCKDVILLMNVWE